MFEFHRIIHEFRLVCLSALANPLRVYRFLYKYNEIRIRFIFPLKSHPRRRLLETVKRRQKLLRTPSVSFKSSVETKEAVVREDSFNLLKLSSILSLLCENAPPKGLIANLKLLNRNVNFPYIQFRIIYDRNFESPSVERSFFKRTIKYLHCIQNLIGNN